jgi:hypothetical protein
VRLDAAPYGRFDGQQRLILHENVLFAFGSMPIGLLMGKENVEADEAEYHSQGYLRYVEKYIVHRLAKNQEHVEM